MAAMMYHSYEVDVTDVFECGGVKLACVTAIDGKPFIGGDKWPIRTKYTVVRADELTPIEECGCVTPEQSCPACRAAAANIQPLEEIF